MSNSRSSSPRKFNSCLKLESLSSPRPLNGNTCLAKQRRHDRIFNKDSLFSHCVSVNLFFSIVETSREVFRISTSVWIALWEHFEDLCFWNPLFVLLAFFRLEYHVFTNTSSNLTYSVFHGRQHFYKWWKVAPREKCPNTEFFLDRIFRTRTNSLFTHFSLSDTWSSTSSKCSQVHFLYHAIKKLLSAFPNFLLGYEKFFCWFALISFPNRETSVIHQIVFWFFKPSIILVRGLSSSNLLSYLLQRYLLQMFYHTC